MIAFMYKRYAHTLYMLTVLCCSVDPDDIYEDVQRPPTHRSNSNGWSSSEFEDYDELSDSEAKSQALSSSKVPETQRSSLGNAH